MNNSHSHGLTVLLRRTIVLILFVFSTRSTLAFGHAVTGMAAEFDGWTYIPIFNDDDVHSFVILRTSTMNVGNNINSMWFVRDGSSWTGYAWRSQDIKEALTDVKNTLNLDERSNSLWPVSQSLHPDAASQPAEKSALATGVFQNDPLAPTIESQTDPTALLSILVSSGWQASDAVLFKSVCRRDQLLNGLVLGFEAELNDDGGGVIDIAEAIDDTICQGGGGGGGGPITCTPSTIIGGVSSSGCIFLGWTFVATTTSGTSPQGCWIDNEWSGRHFYFERRTVRKIYSNCTSCTMTQTRYKNCTDAVVLTDTAIGFQTPCAIPAGYTPPAPNIPTSCGSGTEDCENWGGWAPPIDSVCP